MIPCNIRSLYFARELYNLGDSINLMPLLVYKKIGFGSPKLTSMRLLMAN